MPTVKECLLMAKEGSWGLFRGEAGSRNGFWAVPAAGIGIGSAAISALGATKLHVKPSMKIPTALAT